MREINIKDITKAVKKLCIESNYYLSNDVKDKIISSEMSENWPIAKNILNKILDNANIAKNENVPICQDTGMACIFIETGQ